MEIVAIMFDRASVLSGLIAIPLVLLARFLAVGLPFSLLKPFSDFTKGTLPVLVWGGLRGGISIALALSLPASPVTELILTVTYVVVIFSVVVQGATMGMAARRFIGSGRDEGDRVESRHDA
jgi:CPA1 family monovalent cation:H+ antiporter